MLACSWNEALANCQLRIFWATSVESSRRSRVHEHLCISLRALWVPPLTRTFSKRCQLIFFHLHHDQKYYYLHTWGNHEILNLFETQPEISSTHSKLKYWFSKTNQFFYAHKKSQEKNSFLKCLVMSKVIYFVIWIVSTLLLEKISDSEKL